MNNNDDTCKIPSRSDLTEKELQIIDEKFSPELIAQFKSKMVGGSKRKRDDEDEDWDKYTKIEIKSAQFLAVFVVLLGTGLTGASVQYVMFKIFGGSTVDTLYNSYSVLQAQTKGCGDLKTGVARFFLSKFVSIPTCAEVWTNFENKAQQILVSATAVGITFGSLSSNYHKLTYFILEKYYGKCSIDNKSNELGELENKLDDELDEVDDDDDDRYDFKKMKGKGSKRAKSVKKCTLKRSKKSKSKRSKKSKSVRKKSKSRR